MNNNRNNPSNNQNRRRGRGSNRPQGGGGRGEQLNRIDSRARGNAPQMLEKYRKLASDAHLNGDRVQAEYYLQFADHYFRVIADQRLRQEEQRQPRTESGEAARYSAQDEADEAEFGSGDHDFPNFDQPSQPYRREEPRDNRAEQPENRSEQGESRGEFRREPRDNRGDNRSDYRDSRPPQRERQNRDEAPREAVAAEPVAAPEAAPEAPAANPFTRDNRPPSGRGLRPRNERREPRPPRDGADDGGNGIDPALLPPAIADSRNPASVAAPEAGEAAAPRRRGRPRKVIGEDGSESLEAVGS